MPIRTAGMVLMTAGGAMVILALATHSITSDGFVTERQAQEYSESATAYHEATSGHNHDDLEAARARFEQASQQVESGRRLGGTLRWWARTIGFSLMIVGGVLWMGQNRAE